VKKGEIEMWVKPMADGSVAVGLVNLGAAEATATVFGSELGLKKVKSARDLWGHGEVKFKNGEYSAAVPSHGVLMLRVK